MRVIEKAWPSAGAARVREVIGRPGVYIMAIVLMAMSFYLIYPVLLVLVYSFNVAVHPFVANEWGLDNWRVAFQRPGLIGSIGNTFLIWGLTMAFSLPTGVGISWVLARTRIPWSNAAEFMFWISNMLPSLATTIGWITLMDPRLGLLNYAFRLLPFVEQGPFNIFSVQGIVWANVMANGISLKVMLLTPAFRNMDANLEEASRVGGAGNLFTMLRVTLPLMIPTITVVFALQLLKVFQSFESELLLGTPIDFFVYSTYLYDLVNREVPLYGQAIVLASLTIGIIALIIPLQRWMIQRRIYTTISSGFRFGLIDIGPWKYPAVFAMWSLIVLLTVLPVASLLLGSVMFRAGFFTLNTVFTLDHWITVLTADTFLRAVATSVTLGMMAGFFSPLLFSLLAYIIVRTRWRGRGTLDWIIWSSGAIPGILSGLGLLVLFLGTPGFRVLFGTIWALIIVVIISGNTTGVNIMKGTLLQVGQDMEDAARVSGAGWVRTYYRIWVPLMMRTLVLLATLNFVSAVGATSSIILLASRDTQTLTILALEYRLAQANQEAASIVAIVMTLLTAGVAVLLRSFGLRLGIQHR